MIASYYALLCICFVSLAWLAYFLSYDYFSYINSLGFLFIFLFLSDEGPTLETLDYTIRILAVHQLFYISICISTLRTQYTVHYVYIW